MVFLAYAIIGFITGIVLYSIRDVNFPQGFTVQNNYSSIHWTTVVGVGALAGTLTMLQLLCRHWYIDFVSFVVLYKYVFMITQEMMTKIVPLSLMREPWVLSLPSNIKDSAVWLWTSSTCTYCSYDQPSKKPYTHPSISSATLDCLLMIKCSNVLFLCRQTSSWTNDFNNRSFL